MSAPPFQEGTELNPDPWDVSLDGKSVVIGLGNPYMRDDGIGIRVAREIRRRRVAQNTLVYEYQALDLSLVWQFRKANSIVIVDALRAGGSVGTVSSYSISHSERPFVDLPNLHALQLYDIFDVASQGLISCPIAIVGIEPKDCSPGEGLSEEIIAAIPRAVSEVEKLLDSRVPQSIRASQ